MAFKLRWTPGATDTFKVLQAASDAARKNRGQKPSKKASKVEGLFKQLEKCVRLLTENPRHPGLQTHEFDSLEHPYDPKAYLNIFEEGWEKRLGTRRAKGARRVRRT